MPSCLRARGGFPSSEVPARRGGAHRARRAYNSTMSEQPSVPDEQLPEDLQPSDDNPLAQPAGDDVPDDVLKETDQDSRAGSGADSETDSGNDSGTDSA